MKGYEGSIQVLDSLCHLLCLLPVLPALWLCTAVSAVMSWLPEQPAWGLRGSCFCCPWALWRSPPAAGQAGKGGHTPGQALGPTVPPMFGDVQMGSLSREMGWVELGRAPSPWCCCCGYCRLHCPGEHVLGLWAAPGLLNSSPLPFIPQRMGRCAWSICGHHKKSFCTLHASPVFLHNILYPLSSAVAWGTDTILTAFRGTQLLGFLSNLFQWHFSEWFRAGTRRLAESLKCWCQMSEGVQPSLTLGAGLSTAGLFPAMAQAGCVSVLKNSEMRMG